MIDPLAKRPLWNDNPLEEWPNFLEVEGAPNRNICSKSGANPGGNGNGTSTVTNKVELPPWVDSAAQANYGQAVQASDNLMAPYSGPRVAGITPGGVSDIAALQGNVGSTNPAFAFGQGVAGNIAGYDPGTIAGSDLSAYMNPYTQNVIGAGMQAIDLQRQQANNQGADQAFSSQAFGGSRQGVQEGVTNAAAAMQAGQLAANLQGQNFTQAQNAAQQDVANRTNTAGLQLNAANTLGSLANTGQTSFLSGTNAALQGQVLGQQNQQQQLDAQQQAYLEAQQYPLQQLQIKMGALGMSPYGQTTSQTAPVPQGNGAMQTLGTVSSGLGILGSVAGLAAMAFSDREAKTDIKKLGKDPKTGLNMYAYRYKGDPKTYPKVVGPMAQEVAKKFPGSVVSFGGNKVINLGLGG